MTIPAARTGPLAGLKVIELGGIGPVPFAGMFFADQGANVLRIDRAQGGFEMPIDPRFDTLQRGKQRVTLDLKSGEGVEQVRDLAAQADVLFDPYRPGVLERLGLGPDLLLDGNPRLVVGRMTGWGQSGPLAQRAGHDPSYIAQTGALHAIGRAGGPPQLPLSLVGDFGGGAMYLVSGTLAALWEAQRSGRGQVVDAAIVDGVAHLMASPYSLLAGGAWRDERGRNLIDSGAPFVDVYETADEKHVAVAALEPPFFAQLTAGLGFAPDELPGQWDTARWPELRTGLAAAFRKRTRDEWAAWFADTDACVSPVLSMAEAPTSPHLAARGTFFERDGAYEPAPAPRFSRTAPGRPDAPSAPGSVSAADAIAAWSSRA
ncbi:CaiB/BaiF CoA-transferase family protein [Microbacterium kribbense]|uniref:CaiB/BaiF CoA-transferase family protein n=1 Tax=Microbacterium kribbense TaxID=433645 RepID=A0ABP7GK06_9MICO